MLLFFGLILGFLIGLNYQLFEAAAIAAIDVVVTVTVLSIRLVRDLPARTGAVAIPASVALLVPWMIYAAIVSSDVSMAPSERLVVFSGGAGPVPLVVLNGVGHLSFPGLVFSGSSATTNTMTFTSTSGAISSAGVVSCSVLTSTSGSAP